MLQRVLIALALTFVSSVTSATAQPTSSIPIVLQVDEALLPDATVASAALVEFARGLGLDLQFLDEAGVNTLVEAGEAIFVLRIQRNDGVFLVAMLGARLADFDIGPGERMGVAYSPVQLEAGLLSDDQVLLETRILDVAKEVLLGALGQAF